MFKKLLDSVQGRIQERKSDHPLGTATSLASLIAGIPTGTPARQLFEVDEWLAQVPGVLAESGVDAALRAAMALDESARGGQEALLVAYLSANRREYLADSVWAALDAHAGHVFDTYRGIIDALGWMPRSSTEKQNLNVLIVRALRAWALRKKLQHFRYRMPSAASWRAAHELVRLGARAGLGQSSCIAYSAETASTVLREYLSGVYLELAPLGSLIPQQLEFVDRFLRIQGQSDGFEFSAQPGANSAYLIDLAEARGPSRSGKDAAGSGEQRFLSTVRQRAVLLKLSAQLRQAGQMPDWLADLPIDSEHCQGAIKALVLNWAPTPPQRSAKRFAQEARIHAVFGFGMARRMVAASHYARMGRLLDYEGSDAAHQFNEQRFGRLLTDAESHAAAEDSVREPEIVNPLDILNRLELSGEKAQMESWTQTDASETGFGALIPAVLPRHRIGTLVASRYVDGIQWRLGLIRRISRDAQGRPAIGIESLGWPSICATARAAGAVDPWVKMEHSVGGEVDALIVAHDCQQLVLPAKSFLDGLELTIRSEEGVRRVRLTRLLERGADFDYIEFQEIPVEDL
jgi:hypothetical protein